MKILICNYEYPPLGGGGGVVTALLAQELARRHEVTVLTSRALQLPADTIENGVRVVRVPVFFRRQFSAANLPSLLSYIPMAIRRAAQWKSETWDVINTHFVLPSGPVGDWVSRNRRIPNVLTLHGGDVYDPSRRLSPYRQPWARLWIRVLLRRADCVVVQSQNMIQTVRRFYSEDFECEVVPPGFNPSYGERITREELGLERDAVLLVSVGRLVARKATDQLIDVVRELGDGRIHLLLIGEGPREEWLRNRVRRLGLERSVHFMGHVQEQRKYGLLRMSDIYVSSTQHEGFGVAFLEAMASGLPVVCYGDGGHEDFLESGVTGYIVPRNDFHQFIACCRQLIGSREFRERFGRENRSRVQAFGADRVARSYEELFHRAIDRCGGRVAGGSAPRR